MEKIQKIYVFSRPQTPSFPARHKGNSHKSNISGGYIVFADGTSVSQAYRGIIAYHHSSDSMRFSTDADSPTMVLDNGRRVGIGTNLSTTPSSTLTVSPHTTGGRNISIYTNDKPNTLGR